jgi:hypothetical protein
MLGRLCCAALVVAACRASPPPAKPPTVARPPQPPTKIEAAQAPACVTVPDVGAIISQATVVDGKAEYCIGATGSECFQMTLDGGVLDRLAERPVIEESKGARVEMTPPELKICEDDGCQSLTPKVLPAAARIRGATNTNGSFAVFLLGDANAGKGYAEIWNVDKTKKAATFRYARGDFRCGEVAMVGDTVYVAATQCGQPAARAGLYSLKGKKLHVRQRLCARRGNDVGVPRGERRPARDPGRRQGQGQEARRSRRPVALRGRRARQPGRVHGRPDRGQPARRHRRRPRRGLRRARRRRDRRGQRLRRRPM